MVKWPFQRFSKVKWISKDREARGCLNHLVYITFLFIIFLFIRHVFLFPKISSDFSLLDWFGRFARAWFQRRFCLASTRRRSKTTRLSRLYLPSRRQLPWWAFRWSSCVPRVGVAKCVGIGIIVKYLSNYLNHHEGITNLTISSETWSQVT